MENKTNSSVYPLAMTAVMAAVMAAAAPFSIAIGPIPLSLCTFVIYLTAYVLGWKRGTAATLVYVLMGAVGLPVCSNFGAGLAKVLGPTGGYILGYLPLALIAGLAVERFPRNRQAQFAGLVLGTGVLYAFGTAWYCFQAKAGLGPALMACVVPFLPGDLIKIAGAMALGPVIRDRLARAGFHPQN